MATNRGQIQIVRGTYTADTCTTQNDLVANQAQFPEIREMLEYADKRYLCTLLVSGGVTPYGLVNPDKTKISNVETVGKPIGDNGYRFRVQGRIEKPSVILSQVGVTQADGYFTLKMADRNLNKGQVCVFNSRFVATVMSQPRGNASSGYIYDFQSPSGDLFSWATDVANQAGTKTCFGGWTSYGEKSLKGYGSSKFPDMFINHTTTQRSTVAITGDAASAILWYNYKGKPVGWMYEEIQQQKAKFNVENERAKWWGVSTMKNADGSIRTESRQIDPETGLLITAGDGFEEQVAGGNVLYGSGTNGNATLQDFQDMMTTLEMKSDKLKGNKWVMVTGTVGYANFQTQAASLVGTQGAQLFQTVNQTGEAGGAKVDVGYDFQSINLAGNQVLCIKHSLFDDETFFTQKASDGTTSMSSTYYFINVGGSDSTNLEILFKSANGVNRSMVEGKLNGMTGAPEQVITEEDAMKYAILKQDLLNVYNTKTCGIIYRS